uniref:Uncharacterized protein At4g22758-like n=1 Tax=Rhizophora mucronata TaxID=61149 RepID=A0A2P2IJ59_RHIMU
MVEILASNSYMLSLCKSRVSVVVSAAFSFGSCKEGWYYRCLGLDP